MKYLAIDYGQKRTGIAVSDGGGSMAFPRKTIQMRTREAFFEELLALIEAEAPDAVVIGLPLNLDGEETLTTRQTRNFAKNLKKKTPLPIFWMEEALSSFEAETCRTLFFPARRPESPLALLLLPLLWITAITSFRLILMRLRLPEDFTAPVKVNILLMEVPVV